MTDRFKYSEVRQKIVDAMREDLMGPREENEVLDENPTHAYVIGMLAPQTNVEDSISEQEDNQDDIDEEDDNQDWVIEEDNQDDIDEEDNNQDWAIEEDDNEPMVTTRFQLPSSIGVSFYIENETKAIKIDVSWGDYEKSTRKITNDKGKEFNKPFYTRLPKKETLLIDFSTFNGRKTKEYQLVCDTNIYVYVTRIEFQNNYSLVTAYIINRREKIKSSLIPSMFQVELKAYDANNKAIFIAEYLCRQVLAKDEFYFEKHPIMGRGRGCAVSWGEIINGKTAFVKSDFIPQYEFPGVSAALPGFDKFFFSMYVMSNIECKEEIIDKLNKLADTYDEWIQEKLDNNDKMKDADFKQEVGNDVIKECNVALNRIRKGIDLLKNNDDAFEAFCFMNKVMLLQRNISNYSKKHSSDRTCKFKDFTDHNDSNNDFGWRPFQIAFILMNLLGIVEPTDNDRDIVDLLYFPTGGGKTEAYLGLMAFVIAHRRLLHNKVNDDFNRDGGVTVILRYTLRLLTTQQRDRITKMVIAAELTRQKAENLKFGEEPISIGFWVGSSVTPNKISDLENSKEPYKAQGQKRLIYNQLLTCPFCGTMLTEDDFDINTDKKSVEIYCNDLKCIFYKNKENAMKIPVYLIDEEIYLRCPTIILSTVDKFARLPWDQNTNALFGRVNQKCDRCGYLVVGNEKHPKSHNKKGSLPKVKNTPIKPFLPPELIIQDELHLITGPLGTIYGAYETIIEDLCSYKSKGKKIKPKYIVSTATIKNAKEQTKCLYGRKETVQFPPNGFEIEDSFFIKEISVKKDPFRNYVGICASGQSTRTTLLRTYAVVLQTVYELSTQDDYKDFIDPYYTLVGYYNSIRELGGTVRLLQDDIPKRMRRLVKKYEYQQERYLNHKIEITSRMSSSKIPEKLKQLEIKYDEKGCLDTAIATNMIAVGMDVDRLGLMIVNGQPKQNSEYIQATSRIGRTYPGLVITLYNPYRPRDLSHYENFTGYHSQLYRFVEGTTATPFAARARDRVLHALIISAIRLKYPEFAANDTAHKIDELKNNQLKEIKNIIFDKLEIIKPIVREEVEDEIDQFIDWWKKLAKDKEKLYYYMPDINKDNNKRLMNYYSEDCKDDEKPTLNSMRDVEKETNMYYYTED